MLGRSDGCTLGATDGNSDGHTLGYLDGQSDGCTLGCPDGEYDGTVLGADVGCDDGIVLGKKEGRTVGDTDGSSDGNTEGEKLGPNDGILDGTNVGAVVKTTDVPWIADPVESVKVASVIVGGVPDDAIGSPGPSGPSGTPPVISAKNNIILSRNGGNWLTLIRPRLSISTGPASCRWRSRMTVAVPFPNRG